MDRWDRTLNTASMHTSMKQVPQRASSRIVRCFEGCGFQWFHNRNLRRETAQMMTIHIDRLNVAPDCQHLHQQMSWASENIQTPALKEDRCRSSAHMLETKWRKVFERVDQTSRDPQQCLAKQDMLCNSPALSKSSSVHGPE